MHLHIGGRAGALVLYPRDYCGFSQLVNVHGKGPAIAAALRLAAKHDRDAEYVIVAGIEH